MPEQIHPFTLATITQKIAALATDHPESIPAIEAGLDLADAHNESRTQ